MASSVKVVDKLPAYTHILHQVLDDAVKETALDILTKSRNKAPFLKGGLRSDSDFNQMQQMWYRVSYWKEYARFQEFGGDANKQVRKYSTAGTGKEYLKSSGDESVEAMERNIKKHGLRARV